MTRRARPAEAPPPEPGLRARKKAEARAALVEAALRLFAERGFDAVSVDAIAREAGYARRTFFRHFATKEDAALERRREQIALLERRFEEASLASDPVRVLEDAVGTLAVDYAERRERVLAERALFASSPSLAQRDRELDRAVEEAIARMTLARLGGRGAALRARLFGAAAVAVIRIALDAWAEGGGAARALSPEVQRALRTLGALIAP
jgi:AcrR family transcriptional regulator